MIFINPLFSPLPSGRQDRRYQSLCPNFGGLSFIKILTDSVYPELFYINKHNLIIIKRISKSRKGAIKELDVVGPGNNRTSTD